MKSLIISLVLMSVSHAEPLKNVIFIVGDGMGLASVVGTRVFYKGVKGKLSLEKFKTIGLSKTYPTDDYTTDSAAGATAFATGVKTYNGAISVSDKEVDKSKKSQELQTVIDIIKSKGMSAGIITTTSVTHATPACFYAHVDKRSKEQEIAKQALSSNLDFIMGGGQDFFEKLNTSKWKHIKTKKELARLTVNPEKPVLATFSKNHMPYSIENTNAPELIDMVKWGYNNIKRNKKGYFLMIEAGRIDHAGHENEAEKQFGEVLALDKAIEYLLRTVDLSNTLIVVTADHETGGLALSGYGSQKKVKGDHFLKSGPKWAKSKYISWATGPGADNGTGHLPSYNMKAAAHTTIDVPIYSIGKGHQKMGGFMNNNEIIHRILKLMNLKFTAKANLQNL